MYQSVELLIPLAGIAMIFGIVYISVTAENRKKLAMIEAGMNPDEKKPKSRGTNLKNALLLIFIPIGFIVGRQFKYLAEDSSLSGILGAFIFGGLALLLYYFIQTIQGDKD